MDDKEKNLPFPEELIVEILLRLPVKSLLRFRCVSKSWLSFISNPHFAKSHFELAAARTHRLLCITTSDFEARTLDLILDASLHDDSDAVKLLLPPHLPPNLEIRGSCRGFLLLDDDISLILWNPSTGVHKQISYPSHITASNNRVIAQLNGFGYDVSKFRVIPQLYGFGYDASTDDYLVLIVCYDPGIANLAADIEIFSLRINSWNKIDGIHLPYCDAGEEYKAGLPLNGAIHWMTARRDTDTGVIIAFDLMQKNFSEIPPPDGLISCYFSHLTVLGGYLSLCFWDDDKTDIWVMKKYNVQSSWTKSFVVSTYEIPTNYFYPICFTKGDQIVGSDGMGGLVTVNDKGELLEHRTYCDDHDECLFAMYIESLLSLPNDSRDAREDE